MTPVDQRIFGFPDGDCFTACIASILDLSWESLADARAEYLLAATDWVRGGQKENFDWKPMFRAINALGFHPTWIQGATPRGPAIASGKSPRGEYMHAVVAVDGKVAHDPHPSRAGLDDRIVDFCVLVPIVEDAR